MLFNSHGVQLKNLHDHKMESIHVMGDRMALRRVILNLLDNALKFTPYSGTVTISLRCEGDSIFLDIADTGIGIAEEECEKYSPNLSRSNRKTNVRKRRYRTFCVQKNSSCA